MQVKDYLEASKEKDKLYSSFESLDLTEEQKETIRQWTEAIHAQNAAYAMVVFRMAMQCCFFPACTSGGFKVTENRRYSITF